MRANSRGSSRISSRCPAMRGAISVSSSRIGSVDIDWARLEYTSSTRSSVRPDRSSASMVFSNVGSLGSSTTAATSARCSANPASNAGR